MEVGRWLKRQHRFGLLSTRTEERTWRDNAVAGSERRPLVRHRTRAGWRQWGQAEGSRGWEEPQAPSA